MGLGLGLFCSALSSAPSFMLARRRSSTSSSYSFLAAGLRLLANISCNHRQRRLQGVLRHRLHYEWLQVRGLADLLRLPLRLLCRLVRGRVGVRVRQNACCTRAGKGRRRRRRRSRAFEASLSLNMSNRPHCTGLWSRRPVSRGRSAPQPRAWEPASATSPVVAWSPQVRRSRGLSAIDGAAIFGEVHYGGRLCRGILSEVRADARCHPPRLPHFASARFRQARSSQADQGTQRAPPRAERPAG